MPVPVTVTDILRNPIGQPLPKVKIRIITTTGSGSVLSFAEVEHVTDANGLYNFELLAGTHNIYVKYTDTFEYIGTSIVNESVPSPSTINELLHFSTPIQPDIVNDIYDTLDCCINDLENDINTCTTQISEQVVQGDVGVCQSLTTYTNECLQACSAELQQALVAGDAAILQEAQVYTDACGTEIAQCTTSLRSDLTQLDQCFQTACTEQGQAIADTVLCLQAGDATVEQRMCAYTDTCTGEVETSLSNLITACTAAVEECLTATPNFAAYQVKASIGDVSASIGVIASQECIDGKDFASSCVIMKGDKVILWNGLCDASSDEVQPFVLCNNTVYMCHTMINCLESTCIKTSDICGSVVCGSCICGGAINVNDRFTVNSSGVINISAQNGNVGMKINNERIDVYDASGRIRVSMGKLT